MKNKPYIGITPTGEWLGFRSTTTPTEAEYGANYRAVIGPFTTRRAQLWALKYGKLNPHFQTVRDAERLAKADHDAQTIIYENKWCKIVSHGPIYVLKSKSGKYNDQYFTTYNDARKAIGLPATN